ncbi:sigma-54-dependent transcriptional regulator [Rahnella aceris]|jgi:DNA-binding NtrC family response regulator|uniref:sigma-54-dependent transcriptional regulator n=1 Tax=Rahnella sp. (strain Y9602) TaxID=2703885 RepID=UPI001905E581|nr:sigma-54 dependent transcriptional regulator [Rahnella aceris]MBU9867237.1 sigma-54-dependent Fis family transcriptional regulator [Rahnella aceris]QQN37739.1 sigma-54-dependent Fis family transcriptional regulator [Rahnella aceris]UNK55940.1 sigma-54 dependent transcriptional regulator [Rahnella aceris]
MNEKKRILVIDDDAGILTSLDMLLRMEGYDVTLETQANRLLSHLSAKPFDLVLMDMNFQKDTTSGLEGLQLLDELKKFDDCLPAVAMTGWGSVDIIVSAMRAGAADFIQKPWDNERLLSIVQQQIALSQARRSGNCLREENKLLKMALEDDMGNEWVVRSQAMKQLINVVETVAGTDTSILILGENGTGKSLLARYIHQLSSRREHSIVEVNMGCINEQLFESEMFGHVKGAFTDARENRIGRFELADKGTLFLDEIGNLPLSQQVKLLRVLEERQFERVGSSRTQTTQCRIIAATNTDLEKAVTEGRFRQDLLYRLNVIQIPLPPLRERQEDIEPLAERFLQRFARKYSKPKPVLSAMARQGLHEYSWPGNIRELSHLLERGVLLCRNNTIDLADLCLPLPVKGQNSGHEPQQKPVTQLETGTLAEVEETVLLQRLRHYDGNAVKAAESLGLSRSAFYRRLDKLKICHE